VEIEGINLEYESGSGRTTLEVIQSKAILLDSRINLATAERDFLISQFSLLSSIGRLTAQQLNLQGVALLKRKTTAAERKKLKEAEK